MEIIIDDRERAVIDYFEDLSHQYHINYKIQRLQVGDYAICYRGYIIIIIERKTWADLAASLRDGRKANINKLLSLRDSTGCQIAYLIEGDAFPKPDKLYSRMPAKNLRSHLDHLAFRDGVHMVHTKDQEHTAYRIFELARNYTTIKPSALTEIDLLEKEKPKNQTEHKELENQDLDQQQDQNQKVGGNQNLLTDKQINVVNYISIQEQLLRSLPGVGSIISTLLAENNITIYSIYHQQNSAEQIARLKYPTGAALGLEKANKIFAMGKLLRSNSALAKKVQLRMLLVIPLISKSTAEKILETVSISDILEGNTTVEILKDIQRTERSKLGEKAASNILEMLRYGSIDKETKQETKQVDKPAGNKPIRRLPKAKTKDVPKPELSPEVQPEVQPEIQPEEVIELYTIEKIDSENIYVRPLN